jgi:acyl-coenzyme A thioesterase PaaI-like protein
MMNPDTAAFISLMKHPLKFRMFLLTKLPSAYFAGVRVREVDEKKCVVTVPYKWFSKNPFRSTYFACLAMAAEMSTGALALTHLYKRKPAVSMLVVKVEGEYFKKAADKTSFVCVDGELIKQRIEDSIASGEAKSIRARSTGTNEKGELVAEFFITWSFKAKTN